MKRYAARRIPGTDLEALTNTFHVRWYAPFEILDRQTGAISYVSMPRDRTSTLHSVKLSNLCPSCRHGSNHKCKTGDCFHCDRCGAVIP